jgi:uncharacterized protein YjbJ (UPF0337 family)
MTSSHPIACLCCLSCFGVSTKPQTEASKAQKKSCDDRGVICGPALKRWSTHSTKQLYRNCPARRNVLLLARGIRILEVTTMDWNRIQGNWKQAQGRIKEKWGKLTDDDLAMVNGQREQLEGIIEKRYGLAKDMVRKDVDAWLKSQS